MKPQSFSLLAIVFFSLVALSSYGQTMASTNSPVTYKEVEFTRYVITRSDEKYIKSRAERVVKRFMDLLNFIATGMDLEVPELEKVIYESYSLTENKIFYDSNVVIEDDLSSTEMNKKSKQKTVLRYLNDFDLVYRKSNELSVIFSNFHMSNIKSGNYLYIKVFYDCMFNNKSTISGYPYSLRKRVAELKVEKINNKWKAWIIDVHFLDSIDITSGDKDDVAISEDPPSNTRELYDHYMKEALFAESERNYDEASRYYKLALSNSPDEAVKLNFKIRLLTTRKSVLEQLDAKYMAGQHKDAINEYNKAIEKDPLCSEYYFGRGKCHERLGDFKQALKDYNKAIEHDGYNAVIFKARGALNEIQGDYLKAIADYTVYANMDKTDVYIYNKIAFLQVALGNSNAAIDALDKALLINKNTASFFHLKGELLYKLKRTSEAQSNFVKAIHLDSANAASYFYKGLCEVDLKRLAEAGEDLLMAKKLNIDSSNLRRIQELGADFYKDGCSRYDSGTPDSAIIQLNYSILIEPDKDEYRFKRGECFFKLSDFASAIKDYTDAVKLNPAHYNAYNKRGNAKLNLLKYEEAIADFATAIKLNPKLHQTYKYLGDAYLRLKDYYNAIANYEAFLSVSKTAKASSDKTFLAELYSSLGEAYYYSGNPLRADYRR